MKEKNQLGCVGATIALAICGLIWWNDWRVGIQPGLEASRARRAVEVGRAWPEAVIAAEHAVPPGRMFYGKCTPPEGKPVYFGRFGHHYSITDGDFSVGYASTETWQSGLKRQIPVCGRLMVSVNRDYEFWVELDATGRVKSISDTE